MECSTLVYSMEADAYISVMKMTLLFTQRNAGPATKSSVIPFNNYSIKTISTMIKTTNTPEPES